MSRRSTVTRVLAAVGLACVPFVPAVPGASASPPSEPGVTPGGDRLVVTVTDSGDPEREGTHVLYCHPAGGDHPEAKGACDGLDEVTVWGKEPFAPVAPDARCARIYGGPATAHVRGMWAGRPVDARFQRTDGCEIERWDRVVPLLPEIS